MLRAVLCTAATLSVLAFGPSVPAQFPPRSAPRSETLRNGPQQPVDFARARELLQKRRRGEQLTFQEQADLRGAVAARGARGDSAKAPITPREQTGLEPLDEMSADDRYQGQEGGLYGRGRNTPPDEHRRAAEVELAKIQPLGADGKPAADGRIVLVSISMSNATQEFSTFKRIADADKDKSPQLTIVDCAQGGQAMAEWASPDAPPWRVAAERLAAAGVSPLQVQLAWIKLANKGPSGNLEQHGRKLQRDTLGVIQSANAHFPNLRIAYLSSRIYGGYATGGLNPEPYAYESAYVVRWLIQDQMQGAEALNYDPDRGLVRAPLLLWGPYLWADGTNPRKSDRLVWNSSDFAGDGVHPSASGREKVARLLLEFFKTDPLAKTWFVR